MTRRCAGTGCRAESNGYCLKRQWCGGEDCKQDIFKQQLAKEDKAAAKKRAAIAKVGRVKQKADVDRIETLQQACGKAQTDFNRLIVAYDKKFYGKCISSGAVISDAGHLIHRGSKYRTSWLTFFHANLHGQGAKANRYDGGGDSHNYRRGLIARHGKDWLLAVERMKLLEDRGELPKPTKEEVRAMSAWCRAMTRIYNKG